MKSRRRSIRSSLAWLVAGCLIPAILLVAALIYYDYRQQRAELLRTSISSARALMASIDREFMGTQASLRALATSPSLDSQNYAAFHAQAKELLRSHTANNILLFDAGGQQLMNTATPFGQLLPKTGNPAQLQRVLASGKSDISNLFFGLLLKKPVIHVAVPISSGGAVTQSLVSVILPAHFQKIIADQQLPSNRIAVIFDASGAVIARTHEIDRFLGKPVAPNLFKRLKEVDEDVFESVTLEGIPVVTSYTRSATSRWGVAIGIPVAELTADLQQALWLLVGLATLLLASSVGLAWLLGGRISRSIAQLVQPSLNLALGKAVHVPELAIKEADELGRALVLTSTVLESTNSSLKNSEARMRGILQSAMDAIITVDDRQIIVLFNSAACAMFRCTEEQAVGAPVTRFIPERFHARHEVYVEKNRTQTEESEGFGIAGTAFGLRQDGEEFPLEVSYSNVVEAGDVFHTLILRDITSRVRAYKALERSNMDLQQFAYVASHDLKTPLRSIAGFVQLLEKNHASKLDEKAVDLIRRTAAAAARLDQLTDDLLSYARIGSDVMPFVPVDLGEVFNEVLHLLDATLRSSGAAVTAGPLPTVQGDKTQLVRLLLNLIGNAIKYCTAVPTVHVQAERQDGGWMVSVADNGIGIDPKHHDRVFEVFKRLHTDKEYAGTGIGLAICRRVVSGHGGKIWITSEVGQGSTFCFTIPDTLETDNSL